jgi:hypothetical protein
MKGLISISCICRIVLVALFSLAAKADTPLPPPEEFTVCSDTKAFCATSKPEGSTIIFTGIGKSYKELWQISGWHRSIFVSNSGVVAVAYDGINLLPLDFNRQMVMLKFYKDGHLLREVRLQEIVRDTRKLRRTVSHYEWGSVIGFETNGRLALSTVEEQHLLIDPVLK